LPATPDLLEPLVLLDQRATRETKAILDLPVPLDQLVLLEQPDLLEHKGQKVTREILVTRVLLELLVLKVRKVSKEIPEPQAQLVRKVLKVRRVTLATQVYRDQPAQLDHKDHKD